MNKDIKTRVLNEANHIIKTQDTIRKTAGLFNVSKSTVHTDLSERLKEIDKKLGAEIDDIFKNHDKEKHIRGGEVTRQKYKRG
ncbi:MAG: sporulation transcriptional regulator SpoIIID [Firmicutes bacterium]|jgi:hypothetical protein|nr:sporulation transcriptional regulator SpoIIID [Bacillota bacterium]